MNVVLVVLAISIAFLICIQIGQWQQYVLPVYILPFGAVSLVMSFAGAVMTLYAGSPFMWAWIVITIIQAVYIFVLGIMSVKN